MDLVPLRFATGKDFLRANKTTTRILHRTRASFPRGEEVVLDIAFPGLDVPILVRAVVAAAGTSTAVIFRPLECEKDTWRHLRRVAAGTGSMSRSHVRYPAEVAVDCRSRDGRRIRARCRDLSVGGVSVDSSACPDVGTRIRVAIGPLADGSVFLAYGLVAWVGDSSFGVRFLGPTSAALRVALRRASETGVNERLVVTVLGPDRPGLVEAVSKVVEGHGGNWEASRMVRLAGRFAGVLLVTSSDDVVDRLATDLRALGQEGLQVVVERGDDDAPPDSRAMELELVGHDQPGIVRKVSAVLASRGVNIDELDSTCESAPMAGHNLFKVHAMVRAPMALDVAALRAELEGLAGDLMVDISLAESVES